MRNKSCTKVCPVCAKTFKVFACKRDLQKYCSRSCCYKDRLRRMQVTCEACGKVFWRRTYVVKINAHQFCSHTCRASVAREAAQVVVPCAQCGKSINRMKKTVQRTHRSFCSRVCKHAYQIGKNMTGVHLECLYCRKLFYVCAAEYARYHTKFCSDSCRRRHARAHKNPWAPYPEEYYQIRPSVLSRDGYCCVLCHATNRKLCVHHIDHNKKNNLARNLITLCSVCHGKHGSGKRELNRSTFYGLIVAKEF